MSYERAVFKVVVQISPNARKNEVVGWQGDRVKIKIGAPAVDGKANAELIRYLAERLDLPRGGIAIERGETAKTKLIAIDGIDEATFCEKMELGRRE